LLGIVAHYDCVYRMAGLLGACCSFIVEDLKAVDRSRTPWLIVGGHRPIYIDSTNDAPVQGDQTVAADLRAALEQEFIKYEVRCKAIGQVWLLVAWQRPCDVRAPLAWHNRSRAKPDQGQLQQQILNRRQPGTVSVQPGRWT
jgi:hypothetical protein